MAKSKKQAPLCQPGDVYAVPLSEGRLGAVRVLGRDEQHKPQLFYLVATSPYLGREPPQLDDSTLRQILHRTYFAWAGRPALLWLRGAPPSSLIHLGNIPLTEAEASTECGSFGPKWVDWSSNEAELQWRWEHDREALVAEVNESSRERQARLAREKRQQRPKKMLPEDDFWALIAELGQPTRSEAKAKAGLERLISKLAERTRTDIQRFEETLTYKLYQLDTQAHAEASENSDDGFLYARCVVVSRGPGYYESVLAKPAKMPTDVEFEDLLYVARTAFERKTGEEFEYSTGCSYETGSNVAAWPEE
jgi:hypothetical protein